MSCKKCGSCGVEGCEGQQDPMETMDLMTKYSYSIVSDPNGVEVNEPNFRPYEIFTLNTKLAPHVRAIGLRESGNTSTWYPRYEQRKIRYGDIDRMVITVQIYNGIDFVSIQRVELRDELQRLVDICTEDMKGYALVLHDRFPIYHKKVHLDHTWYKTILKTIPIPNEIKYSEIIDKVFSVEGIYKEGGIYVELSGDLDYETTYNTLHIQTLDNIVDLYKKGAVVLDDSNPMDIKFIQDWNLVKHKDGYVTPRWVNKWIAPEPSLFLMKRRSGIPYVSFNVGNNNVVRHYVSIELNREKFRYTFSDTEVLIWVRNIIRADRAHGLVMKSMSMARGRVKTDKDFRFNYVIDKSPDPYVVPMLGKEYTEYTDLYRGVTRSTVDTSD